MQLTENCLILHGGVDINPSLYGQKRNPFTQSPNNHRDKEEVQASIKALEDGLPIIGICRGAQLLTVLHGGSLWQHTNNHCRHHPLITKEGERIADATSCHHQVMNLKGIGSKDYQVLAIAHEPDFVWGESNHQEDSTISTIPEVVWFPKTKCLAIQAHPEWELPSSPFRQWLDPKIKELLGFSIAF